MPSTRRSRHVAAIWLIATLAGGCYRYTPLTTPAPVAGSVVRLDLSDAGAERLSTVLGRNTIAVEGTVVSANDTEFVVAVSGTRQRNEQPLNWAGEHVTVPRSAVQAIESRSLDKKKTLVVVGLAILGGIAAKVLISGLSGSAGGDEGGIIPPPP